MRLAYLILPLALAACIEDPAPTPDTATMPDQSTCGAAELQDLVGQSARVLETMRFGHTVRIIRPGMAITMDYSPDRLNIAIDQKEMISRVSCG